MAGNASVDVTSGELIVDRTAPPAPGVTSQTTAERTPVIEGTVAIATGTMLTVEVNGVLYTEGDGQLTRAGDGTWSLAIPSGRELADDLYQVIATLTDEAGNASVDGGTDELAVDTLAPPSPGVSSLTVADRTPRIEGTATLADGETLSVEVAGQVYLAGDGALVDNGDGTWALTIPAATPLVEGAYDVTAVVTDAAGNRSADPSSGELTIDLTAPSAPTVAAIATNANAPTIEGTATLGAGESLSVEVAGRVYSVGDGFLEHDGSGGWTLTLPG